ncbi:hypothetical protein LSAT2_015317 [Lamellibrachia satsuma]|nr:hypothetical protein LSAT2_015317 [Lamellibrachia satsuma]
MHAKTAIQATVLMWWLIHTVRCQGDSKTGDPMKVNAARFMDVIDRITNEALSFKEVEKFVQTRLEVTGEMKQHNALLEELKQDILGKLKNLTDPVHALKMTIQKYFFGFAQQLADVQDCCHLSIDTTTDIQYNTQVGVNHMCVTHPPASGQEGKNAKFATRSVLLQFLTNRATFATTVQFYGTEDGILHLHPATKMATCNNYDPRCTNSIPHFLVDCYLVVVRRLVYPYDPLSYTGGRQLLAGPIIPGRSGASGQTKHSPVTSLDHGAWEENGLRPLRKTCEHSGLG